MAKKVILAGGSGFLGQALGRQLAADGCDVVVLSRNPRDHVPLREVLWNAETGGAWAAELEGAAAVVNLAGRSINCDHSLAHSREILDSRISAVKALGKGCARAKNPPPVWVQCSATGIYGNAGDRFCEEALAPGPGFLAEVCRLTEAAFQELPLKDVRRVVLRLGVVLDRDAGMFPMLAGIVRRYLGGAAGGGRQYISWIHREDAVRIFLAAIDRADLAGVYNACAPGPVNNTEFMRAMRAALGRPWAPPAPEFAVRLIAGQVLKTEANLILHGQRCKPQRLLDQGFTFNFPALALALADLTKKMPPAPPPPAPVPSAPAATAGGVAGAGDSVAVGSDSKDAPDTAAGPTTSDKAPADATNVPAATVEPPPAAPVAREISAAKPAVPASEILPPRVI